MFIEQNIVGKRTVSKQIVLGWLFEAAVELPLTLSTPEQKCRVSRARIRRSDC